MPTATGTRWVFSIHRDGTTLETRLDEAAGVLIGIVNHSDGRVGEGRYLEVTPDQAKALAAALVRLAEEAEAPTQ